MRSATSTRTVSRGERPTSRPARRGRPPCRWRAYGRRSNGSKHLWTASTWLGTGIIGLGAEVPLADLPFFRLREVAIHHVDLRMGFDFNDLPPPYVRLEVRRMEMLWQARQPMGLTPLPAAALALAPPARLAWLMGRHTVEGLAPADVF